MEKKEFLTQIPYTELMKMHRHFNNNIGRHLGRHYGRPDTSSIWFENNDDFKRFLSELQDPRNEVSGVRVYLCQYGPDLDIEIPAGYGNRLTVGFAATKLTDGRHVDDQGTKHKIFPVDPYNTGKICPPDICPEP